MKRCALLLITLIASLVAFDVRAEDQLVLLDGSRVKATVTAIDPASGKITAAGLNQAVDLQSLRSLERPEAKVARPKAPYEIHLAGGGVVLAESLKIADEQVTFSWAYGKSVVLPLDSVHAILFASPAAAEGRPTASDQGREAFAAVLGKPRGDKDSLLVVVEGKVQTLSGLANGWQAGGVAFDWEGETRQIPFGRAYGIVLAQLGTAYDASGECMIATTDGSSATARIKSLADNKLVAQLHSRAEATIPWDAVRSITVKSDRLVYLSDIKPVDAQVKPIVTLARPWQADRNVLGGKLALGGQSFEKGLGVMSRTALVYQQPTGFDTFAATIGLDASTGGRGNCVFVVLADGKEVFRQAQDGKSQPREVRVSTAGAQRISLIVEPGEDLDLSDHADWCDARLLKAGERKNEK